MCMCEHAGMWSSKTCKNFLSIARFKNSILRIWDLAHSAWYCAVHTSVVFFSVWVDVLVIALACVLATSVCDEKLDRKFKFKTNTASVGQQPDRKEMEVRGEYDQPVVVPKAALIRRQGLVNPRGPLLQEPFGSSFFKYNIFGMKKLTQRNDAPKHRFLEKSYWWLRFGILTHCSAHWAKPSAIPRLKSLALNISE